MAVGSMLRLQEALGGDVYNHPLFYWDVCIKSWKHNGEFIASPRLPVRSTLNNSCFPVKCSGLVGSHWILGPLDFKFDS